jgi:hypothetical protein
MAALYLLLSGERSIGRTPGDAVWHGQDEKEGR